MKPSVSTKFREVVSNLVRQPNLDALGQTFEATPGRKVSFGSVLPDVLYFDLQTRVLRRQAEKQYAAIFQDDGPKAERLPVLVRIPELDNVHPSYGRLLEALSKSDIPLETVSPEEAREIFVDRLSEFLAARVAVPPGPAGLPPDGAYSSSTSALTIVHSNRNGDTVLYALGYFTSTGTAFGISTPARGHLSGRYSFGIIDSGTHRFDNVIWTCPTTVKLNLP
jgi:hypothetical protein